MLNQAARVCRHATPRHATPAEGTPPQPSCDGAGVARVVGWGVAGGQTRRDAFEATVAPRRRARALCAACDARAAVGRARAARLASCLATLAHTRAPADGPPVALALGTLALTLLSCFVQRRWRPHQRRRRRRQQRRTRIRPSVHTATRVVRCVPPLPAPALPLHRRRPRRPTSALCVCGHTATPVADAACPPLPFIVSTTPLMPAVCAAAP